MLSILAGVKLEARWGKDKIRTAAMEPTEDSSRSFFPITPKQIILMKINIHGITSVNLFFKTEPHNTYR